jgi:hypothetical protein
VKVLVPPTNPHRCGGLYQPRHDELREPTRVLHVHPRQQLAHLSTQPRVAVVVTMVPAAATASTAAAAAAAAVITISSTPHGAGAATALVSPRGVALQVAFERQTLKPVFQLIGFRLWV